MEFLRGEVTVQKDLLYGYSTNYLGQREAQTLDLYTTERHGQGPLCPLLVFVHGGGFRLGIDKTQPYVVHYSKCFARRGYTVAAIEYRRRSRELMPTRASEFPALLDGTQDLDMALRFLRSQAEIFHIDPQAIFLAGGSAGGRIVVSMCCYEMPNEPFERSGIVAAANLWGSPEPELRCRYAFRGIPMLIIHGSADPIITPQNSVELAQKLTKAGIVCELHMIEGGAHPPSGSEAQIEQWMSDFFGICRRNPPK